MQEQNGHWFLEPRIKRRVEFRQLNLVTEAFPGNGDLDLIFCRNVLIYFEREAIAIVARKLVEALSEGGYLIMGPSDPSLLGHVPLEPIIVPEGVFFRRQKVVRVDVPVRVHMQPESDEGLSEPESSPVVSPIERIDLLVAPMAPIDSRIEAAHLALSEGNYVQAVELAREVGPSVEASAIHVRALANIDPRMAEHTCAAAVAMFPMSAELRYLHASLLVGLDRDADAEETLRRALYLDRMLAVCHALLGMILARRGDVRGACRAFRNAHRICSSLPPNEPVQLSNGEPAEVMAKAMARHVEGLGATVEVAS
jgi:chemotaxis protein methyltransferase CheR